MNINKILFHDVYCSYKQMAFVAGELLSVQQFKDLFETVFSEYNIQNVQAYKNINSLFKKEIISYTCDLFDYFLLNQNINNEYHLSFNDCCIIYGLYNYYNYKRKTFSPESLNSYISQLYNIDNFFLDEQYLDSTKNAVKKFAKITSLQKNKKQFSSVIFPLFICGEISLNIYNDVVTNYIIVQKPNLEPCKEEMNLFSEFMNLNNIL